MKRDTKSFKNKLYSILDDLSYNKRSREKLMEICVSERLDRSLEMYIKSLEDSNIYMRDKSQIGLLKRLNK